MPIYYGKDPRTIGTEPEPEPPELDAEVLREIQAEAESLAEHIKATLIDMKHKRQLQQLDGTDLYHKLNKISKAIRPASECIDNIIERL